MLPADIVAALTRLSRDGTSGSYSSTSAAAAAAASATPSPSPLLTPPCCGGSAAPAVGAAWHMVVVLLCFGLFWALFFLSWKLSTYLKAFGGFERHQKADWCSRINSTLHAVVIVPAMLALTWRRTSSGGAGGTDSGAVDMEPITTFFCFSVAYFAQDLVVILLWQVPYWTQFALHHVLAAVPYAMFVFSPGCRYATDVMALFLCVELSTLPLNAQAFLEQTGLGETRAHRFSFYITYVTWLFSRVCLPVILLYELWAQYLLSGSGSGSSLRPLRPCMLPGIVSAHIIGAFCVSVFFTVWTPDFLQRWRLGGPTSPLSLHSIKVSDSEFDGFMSSDTTTTFPPPPLLLPTTTAAAAQLAKVTSSSTSLLGSSLYHHLLPPPSSSVNTPTSVDFVANLRRWEDNLRLETLGQTWSYPISAQIMFSSSNLR